MSVKSMQCCQAAVWWSGQALSVLLRHDGLCRSPLVVRDVLREGLWMGSQRHTLPSYQAKEVLLVGPCHGGRPVSGLSREQRQQNLQTVQSWQFWSLWARLSCDKRMLCFRNRVLILSLLWLTMSQPVSASVHMDAYFPGTRMVQHISVCQVRVPVVYFWFLLGNEV